MILKDIIADSGFTELRGDEAVDIKSFTNDSRKVEKGSMFMAVKGHDSDGHAYISSAIKAGARAVAYEDDEALAAQLAKFSPSDDLEAKSGSIKALKAVTFVKVADSRHAEAIMADNYYDHPSRKLTLVGITGTNGKTTTVTLLYHLFMNLGHKCGLISTIANYIGTEEVPTLNTTPDPITINSLMARMAAEGCDYCFMEVSSIGMQQERVTGLKFKVGIFSNLTHDHLDYHKTFEEYLRCKKLFFDTLPEDAYAITNLDDKNGLVMVQNTKAHVVTYALNHAADHMCRIIEESFEGMELRIDSWDFWTKLIGRHNAYNLLAIYSAAVVLGADPQKTLLSMSLLNSAKGRLETIHGSRNLTIVIDYAHTPDALENVLKTLRDISSDHDLVCVFGCGGDRDKTKRPEMAAVAEKYADRIIVTSDNPRTENPDAIIDDIRKGFSRNGLARTLFITNRREAIRASIMLSKESSIILLAGKGHETYQVIGTEKHHFDEREVVAEIFKEMSN